MQKLNQNMNIGGNLRFLRNKKDITQEEVSAQLEVRGCSATRSTYSRYETGELNIPISHLVALKEIFKCEFEDFFKGLS